MLSFHTNVFAKPNSVSKGKDTTLRGKEYATLVDPNGGPPKFVEPIPRSFEQIQQRLVEIPRMDIEPDGYFLVAGGEPDRWQIDGHLYEYNGAMHRMEIHGRCPAEVFNELLACCGWPDAEMLFELVLEGVTLDEPSFRDWAARDA